VLVADLADAASRDFLAGLALAGGKAYLPLISAPGSASTHLLEVYTPDSAEPLVLFADPLGPPSAVGFPLQLRMYDPSESPRASEKRISVKDQPPPSRPDAARELRARVPTSITLTERHTRDLSGELVEVEPEALVGRSIAGGKLLIESLIGAGGVGSVYRASHRDLQIPVAVKLLHHHFQQDLEFCRRFHSEALAASRLDHPNLMRVLDFGQEPDGLLYLAMEHLDGQALADILSVGVPLPMLRIVDIMMQVCAGLAHAHARGIVHRDVKPANVVLVANNDDDERPDELVKVCDFGIALAQADAAHSTAVVGTPDYMSPEQCRGEVLDGRSDVYSCGVMLYELATGLMPFDAPTPVGLLNRHMHVEAPRPRLVAPEIDPGLEAVIMKALAKEPDDRQQSMRDLRRELRALLEAEASAPSSSEPFTPPPPPLSEQRPSSRAFGAEPDTGPEWLERGGSYRHDSIGEVTVVNVNGRLLAGELATRPAPWLAAFAETARPEQFDALAVRLEAAMPVLVAERNLKTLFAVRSTIDELAVDDGSQPGWRIARARSLQQAFAEPLLLAMLAEAALTSDRPSREVTELLLRAGTPATYAIYSARLKLKDVEGVRRRFVLIVRELGAEALPMIRAGLARLESRREIAVAAALASDLFQASPHVRDEEAGEVTARYLQGSPLGLTCVAAEALVSFWGMRATPLLLGLLACDDDAVRVASINGLRDLRAVDEYAAQRISDAARATSSAEVRSAARSALLQTVGNARVVAQHALGELANDVEVGAG
jgi:serine/threonine protein kinase